MKQTFTKYCELINIRGVLIFVDFMGMLIQEFKNRRNIVNYKWWKKKTKNSSVYENAILPKNTNFYGHENLCTLYI